MVNQLLVTLVNSVLGTGKQTARGNIAYTCPHCKHHKPKLEVNFTENKQGNNPWHCWVCDKKGKNILYLLMNHFFSKYRLLLSKCLLFSIILILIISKNDKFFYFDQLYSLHIQ